MNELKIKEIITQAINNIGLIYTMEELENEIIGDVIPDSITYISFIIELEQVFDIEIPDEYLIPDKLSCIDNIVDMVKLLKD